MTTRAPGRPPRDPRKNRRGPLGRSVKFSAEEYERLAALAAAHGMSVPDAVVAMLDAQ